MAPKRTIPANGDASSSSHEESEQVENAEAEEEESTEEEEEEGEEEEGEEEEEEAEEEEEKAEEEEEEEEKEEEVEEEEEEEEEDEEEEKIEQQQQQRKHETQSIQRQEEKEHDDDDDHNEDEGEEKQQAAFESDLSNVESRALRSTATPSKSSKRRVAAEDASQRKKRLKFEASDVNEDQDRAEESDKKPLFQRLWSPEDECILLKAMIDFKKKALDPITNINAFSDLVKDSIHVEVTHQQLKRKIRGLKDRYKTNARRARGNRTPNFPKPQDLELYKLSKKIWTENEQDDDDDDDDKDNADTKNNLLDSAIVPARRNNNDMRMDLNSTSPIQPKALFSPEGKPKLETNVKEEPQISTEYPCLSELMKPCESWNMLLPGFGGSLIKEGFSLMGRSKAKELERKFRMLQIQELELYLNRMDLVREQTKRILDALKKSM